jgi:methylenetetrahydrofolate reductase (NADPH)
MKSGSRLEKMLEAGHFAFTGELGPPQGANVEAIRKKASYLKGITDAVNITPLSCECQAGVLPWSPFRKG